MPQVDADGNGSPACRMPELAVPLATYTGWNLFNERSGPTDVLSSMQGSYIPLARHRPSAKRSDDPRQSVDERYQGRAQFLDRISQAADRLAGADLLKADLARIVEQAGTRWDIVAARQGTASKAPAVR